MRGIAFGRTQGKLTNTLEVCVPEAGEVCVRIAAAGLCHSDLSVIDATIDWPVPVVLGHEGAGVVESVGPGVSSVAPGDNVVLTF